MPINQQARSSQTAPQSAARPAGEVIPPDRKQENRKEQDRPLDPALTPKIESFRALLGDALYFEVYRAGGTARNARELPHLRAQQWALKQLETLARGVDRVRELAPELQEQVFYRVLDNHNVQSVDKIPSFEVLKGLVRDLQSAARGVAA